MAQPQSLPACIHENFGVGRGLICGYQPAPGISPLELSVESIVASLQRDDVVTWLHFNLSDARARRWLLQAQFLPQVLREVLERHDENRCIEMSDAAMLLVIGDFTFEDDTDPSEVATLWCLAAPSQLITARFHPLKTPDELRSRLRDGGAARSGIDLLSQMLELRSTPLRRLAEQMAGLLDRVEDEILAGNIKQQREQLGRTRRLCARLRRQFRPDRDDMSKFLHRPQRPLANEDRDQLQECNDALGFVLEEIAECYERAKLLQEELSSRVAENTGRNLYALSILTAVLTAYDAGDRRLRHERGRSAVGARCRRVRQGDVVDPGERRHYVGRLGLEAAAVDSCGLFAARAHRLLSSSQAGRRSSQQCESREPQRRVLTTSSTWPSVTVCERTPSTLCHDQMLRRISRSRMLVS
jgi:zinc transporter